MQQVSRGMIYNYNVNDIDIVYSDMISGSTFNRTSYNLLVGTENNAPLLRAGDLLVINSIDRLGRDYNEIRKQWEKIINLGADIKVLDMPLLDTSAVKGSNLDRRFLAYLVLQILSYVAEKERSMILSRQKAGIAAMPVDKKTGKRIGKKGKPVGSSPIEFPENFASFYHSWKLGEITATQAMSEMGLKRNSFYRLVHIFEQD